MRKLNVAIIGQNFMGKAHSHAWRNAPRFFDLGADARAQGRRRA
jgi:predicted dehydrogenase